MPQANTRTRSKTAPRKPVSSAKSATAAKPARGGGRSRKESQMAQIREQMEKALNQGEHAAEALWHQTAVASLHWISSHQSRVSAFKKSIKGTVLEKPVNNALKAIREEAKASASANAKGKKATAKKATAKKTTAKKAPAKKTTVKKAPAKKTTAKKAAATKATAKKTTAGKTRSTS